MRIKSLVDFIMATLWKYDDVAYYIIKYNNIYECDKVILSTVN